MATLSERKAELRKLYAIRDHKRKLGQPTDDIDSQIIAARRAWNVTEPHPSDGDAVITREQMVGMPASPTSMRSPVTLGPAEAVEKGEKGPRRVAEERLQAAQAAYDANRTSKKVEDELKTAKRSYDALLGRRIEGVGGRFGQATPPKDFKGKVGDAPEDLSAEEAEIADIVGSRKIGETGIVKAGSSAITPRPSIEAQRGLDRAAALQEQIAQREREQEAFAAQQGGAPAPGDPGEDTLQDVLRQGGFRGDGGEIFEGGEPPKQRFYRHLPPQVAVEPTLGPAPAPAPKEEPTVREQTQGAAKNALNNAGKAAKRKAYEAAGIF